MGNEQTKFNQASYKTDLDIVKLDTIVKQIYFGAQLSQDRKKGALNAKTKELLALVNQPISARNKENEYQKATSMTSDTRNIQALEIIMRYSNILKDNIGTIKNAKGDLEKVKDLVPYIESVIWGCQRCNIDGGLALSQMLHEAFDSENQEEQLRSLNATLELKTCFEPMLPSEMQVKTLLLDFCTKQGISLEKFNEIGHNIFPGESVTNNSTNTATIPHPGFTQNEYHGNANFNQKLEPSNNQEKNFAELTNKENVHSNYLLANNQNKNPPLYPDFSSLPVKNEQHAGSEVPSDLSIRLNAIKKKSIILLLYKQITKNFYLEEKMPIMLHNV